MMPVWDLGKKAVSLQLKRPLIRRASKLSELDIHPVVKSKLYVERLR